MRASAEFARALKGTRSGSSRLVVVIGDVNADIADLPPKVGFVVSKRVGNSVVRHRVYRQLRHVMREHLDLLEPGESVVVRALPPINGSSSETIASDVERCIAGIRNKQKRTQ